MPYETAESDLILISCKIFSIILQNKKHQLFIVIESLFYNEGRQIAEFNVEG